MGWNDLKKAVNIVSRGREVDASGWGYESKRRDRQAGRQAGETRSKSRRRTFFAPTTTSRNSASDPLPPPRSCSGGDRTEAEAEAEAEALPPPLLNNPVAPTPEIGAADAGESGAASGPPLAAATAAAPNAMSATRTRMPER